MSDSFRETLIILLFTVIVFAIYSKTFNSPFVLDDFQDIRDNPHIRLTEVTLDGIMKAALESSCSNRPVASISFALNYYLHGYDTWGFHLVNTLIHLATGIFLYLLMKITLDAAAATMPKQGAGASNRSLIPFFAALIWLVHPIQTQSVTYIVQRMNSLAAMFCILSLLLYAKGRLAQKSCGKKSVGRIWFAGCLISMFLAFGSKENSATLPFFILLYEWYFFQNLDRSRLKPLLSIAACMIALSLILVYVYVGSLSFDALLSGYQGRDFTLKQRVLTELRVVVHYMSLLIFPYHTRFNLYYDFKLSNSLTDPVTTLFCFVLIVALTCAAFVTARKKRILSFGILWFFGNLVIESSVIGLMIIFEHRVYLPSAFVFLGAVVAIRRIVKNNKIAVPILIAIVTVCCYWTYERNKVWEDELALLEDCLAKAPGKALLHNNLGIVLGERGFADKSIKHYQEAIRIDPDFHEAYVNIGMELSDQGRHDEAVSHFQKALEIKPGYAKAHTNLGITLAALGRLDEALGHYGKALESDPYNAEAENSMGNIYFNRGVLNKAAAHYAKAVKMNPSYAEAYNGLGAVMLRKGKIAEATVLFKKALNLKPGLASAKKNLEIIEKHF